MTETPDEIIHRYLSATPGLIADRHRSEDVAALGLRRMTLLLVALDQPQLAYPTIHIAGSKGKGTVAYVLEALVRAGGRRTGMFTSPHLTRWNERIQIDGVPIADRPFGAALATVDRAMQTIQHQHPDNGQFNAFELLTATAFLLFRDAQVELGVIETGLGGRCDSTNHLQPKVTIITRIEAEHTDVLGDSLSEIAWNKSGIMRSGVPCVVVAQTDEVLTQLAADAEAFEAPLLVEGRDWSISDPGLRFRSPALPGSVNASNIAAALVALRHTYPHLIESDSLVAETLAGLQIPGRFEVVASSQSTLVLDVAHTSESIDQVLRNVEDRWPGIPIDLVFSVLADKQIDAILAKLPGRIVRLVLPAQRNPRAVPASDLAVLARQHGLDPLVAESTAEALAHVRPEAITLVSGSFGLVATARELLRPSN